jgi:hypothetical protein
VVVGGGDECVCGGRGGDVLDVAAHVVVVTGLLHTHFQVDFLRCWGREGGWGGGVLDVAAHVVVVVVTGLLHTQPGSVCLRGLALSTHFQVGLWGKVHEQCLRGLALSFSSVLVGLLG